LAGGDQTPPLMLHHGLGCSHLLSRLTNCQSWTAPLGPLLPAAQQTAAGQDMPHHHSCPAAHARCSQHLPLYMCCCCLHCHCCCHLQRSAHHALQY
jgi:hypothetical protein